MRQGGSYVVSKGKAPRLVGRTEDHPQGNRARAEGPEPANTSAPAAPPPAEAGGTKE